ncbi:hypothetical protein EIN_059310 [Entamoeba invadens IP1]|uniref:Glycerophosphocholine acyltransferase 1 n=1 Tax=Entamoeba invadens TaxID=33085 RepID=S0B3W1_ENTIV|nr:hypothetical protein EIN_059310 [Entamoeba invadens IP1]ELP93446.1 hypothetical protein EIN_059310 [Entamoeba invadens IP1]BAN40527.1 hypothetical protein, conserved [Entamoeba invadens]|eukprot:XP_004260217.1 hypothetical protein EIN_059310 [Entamoeba invadens IP1]
MCDVKDTSPTPETTTSLTEEQLNNIHSYKLGNIKLLDKISFVIGVCLLLIGEYIVLVRPDLMHVFYICMFVPLVTSRYLVYRMNKWHYFLLDFCYYTNATLIITVIRAFYLKQDISWIFPTLYVVVGGPLLTAIPMWNNALVFHDFTKLTSITIHLLPGMVVYCIRWKSDIPIPQELDFVNGFVFPLIFFSIWQTLYLVITEGFKRETIYEEGYMTSVRWLVEEKPHKILVYMRKFFPEKFSYLFVMTCVQVGMYFMTTLPQFYLYKHRFAHQMWITFCFVFCVWNGANYYFDVFVNRYIDYLSQFKTTNANKKEKVVQPVGDTENKEKKD